MSDNNYPDAVCQDCSCVCDITEEVKDEVGHWELWCYCEKCDQETLHPIPIDSK